MSSNNPRLPDSLDDARAALSALFDEHAVRRRARVRIAAWSAAGFAAVLLGWLVWYWAHQMAGVQREAPKISTIIPLPPPPPPPPPKPPEPEQSKPEPVPEQPKPTPRPAEQPKEAETPSPSKDLSKSMEMNADAQAGSDAFNIAAGQGNGMSGSGGGGGLGNATYSRYLVSVVQKLLADDERTSRLAFSKMIVSIWLDANGRITRVEMADSSGDADIDAKVLAALREAPALDERPPANMPMPIRANLKGRRPS